MRIREMLRPIDLAEQYMASFFGDAPLEMMEPLLDENLVFDGPFQQSSTAKDYFESLKLDPPVNVQYKMEKIYENENSVCFIYQFSKPGVETKMVQTFEINEGKICKINLVFDTNAFT